MMVGGWWFMVIIQVGIKFRSDKIQVSVIILIEYKI